MPQSAKVRSVQTQQVTAVAPVLNTEGVLQRKCACGQHTIAGGSCSACGKDKSVLQRKTSAVEPMDTAPPLVHEVLRSPGQPLDPETRAFFEPRFGHDFSRVRAHTDGKAAESTRRVNALAYTVGTNIVFGAGQYAPQTTAGRRLLAHELTHSLQQSRGGSEQVQGRLVVTSANDSFEQEADRVAEAVMSRSSEPVAAVRSVSGVVQRACGSDAIGDPPGCTFSEDEVTDPRYLFRFNCDEFATGNELDLRMDAATIVDGETVEIHGLASIDGDPDFNLRLSCARALRARDVIQDVLTSRGITATLLVFHHGGLLGDATLQRSVVLRRTPPTPRPEPEPETERRCGPDATDWFIRQVNAAKVDPVILALRTRLTGAETVARRFGFSAERIAEGAVAKRVLAEEARVGSPTRTTEASAQIAASVPGQREFGRALIAATVPLVGAPEAFVLAAVRGSALTWKGLVGTGMKYDFKNSAQTLQNPTSDNCPADCTDTVTFCPSSTSDCYLKDMPGNLFYAHVGRFVGWTELALQLGSQFAQLESAASWDPPEDTKMIGVGFALPDPLTRSDLCSAVNTNRSIFDPQECSNCDEEVSAEVV